MFLLITMGATIVTFQSIELLKEPLLESLNKYDPGSADEEILELTRSWDDVQKEVNSKLDIFRIIRRKKN